MTLLFSERQNRLNAGNDLLDLFSTKVRVLIKIWTMIFWAAVVAAPSLVEGFEFPRLKEEAKFIHGNFVLQESPLQYGARLNGSGYQRLGMPQLSEFWSKRLPQLHAGEASGVEVGKTTGEAKCNCSSDDGTENRTANADKGKIVGSRLHVYLWGFLGIATGLIISVPIVWFLCRYVFYHDGPSFFEFIGSLIPRSRECSYNYRVYCRSSGGV